MREILVKSPRQKNRRAPSPQSPAVKFPSQMLPSKPETPPHILRTILHAAVQGPCDLAMAHSCHPPRRRLGDTFMGLWDRQYMHCFIAPGRLLSVDIPIFFPTVHLTFEHRLSIEAARKNNVEIKR
jgi:hypothetical protein